MSETSITTTKTRKGIRIFINDQPYFAPKLAMTGRELMALAGVPEGNQLFLHVRGHGDDRPVSSHQRGRRAC